MRGLLFLTFAVASHLVLAQTDSLSAEALRESGRLPAAISAYHQALAANPDSTELRYGLACAYALMYQRDSAFYYLQSSADSTLWPLADPDFLALSTDVRWAAFEQQQIAAFQAKSGALEQPAYALRLLRLIQQDQGLDYYIDQAKAYYMQQGEIPHWYYPLGAYREQMGAGNFAEMQRLVAEYGWPRYSQVGTLAADAPLLVINHHPSDSVREYYLPQVQQACLEGEGSCEEYAKIQDRVLVNSGQPQRYGMQFRYTEARELEPFPIEDPERVDARRAAIGLGPLAPYLLRKIGYTWTVPQVPWK